MFEFLFKYRPELFGRGELTFLAGPVRLGLVLVGAIAALWILKRYRDQLSVRDDIGRAPSLALLGLRLLGVGALVFVLMEPALALQTIRPQEGFVAVLADTSASMTVPDAPPVAGRNATRAQWVERAMVGPDPENPEVGELWGRLAERFQVRSYRFDEEVARLAPGEPLVFTGRESDLGSALARVRAELTGVPLAGVVVLTDGAIEADDRFADEILEFRQAGTPVLPVALGSERFERDLEIVSVNVPDRSLLGSTVEAEVRLAFPGFAGERVVLEIEDDGRVVERRELELPVTGDLETTLEASFRSAEAGVRKLGVSVRPEQGLDEVVEENNSRAVLVRVEEGPHKILYFEGEPRFEYKFIRRAVADDPQLQLVSLLRMAENRFYRQSVDDEQELQGGFPSSREDLYSYRGLVLGSVEASFFTYEQMRMIVDFVSERGGGVLFLGGSLALGEGGYAGTPLEELMPVELSDLRDAGPRGRSVRVQPTRVGRSHPLLNLGEVAEGAPDAGGSQAADAFWQELPELLLVNQTGRVRPGTSSLLVGADPEGGSEEHLVLAHQRFGAGSSMLFTPTDSFRWQMRLELEDQTHEVFWRQMLRWLINGVDTRVVASVTPERVEPGNPVTIEATVRDERFLPDSAAAVEAIVTGPSGSTTNVPLEFEFHPSGAYRGRYVPEIEGGYDVDLVLSGEDAPSEVGTAVFEAAALQAEFFGAHRRPQPLRDLAEQTGGRVYEGQELDALVEDLSFSTAGVTIREDRPLWNMPILFLMILMALFGEWSIRRWKGLR